MKYALYLTTLLACSSLATAEVYFKDNFENGIDNWVQSKTKDDFGKFAWTAGKFFADEEKSKGLQTSQDARFYSAAAPFEKNFDTTGKDLVVQFSVKHEQNIDCGGGYLKLLPADFEPEKFDGDSPYEIMFGPDICGPTKRVHVIFRYKGDNKLIKKEIAAPSDQLSHLYTLVVKTDQTYKVLIDQKEEASGSLLEDWDFLPPKTIPDPDAKKPEDWVEDAMIPDPKDVKPEGHDDEPEYIPDPEAKKPEDWDDEDDGEWEAPKIENPDFKGKWEQKKIKNPDYKGPWVHPEIPNPEYIADKKIYVRNLGYVGFDLWQVKSGTIFDNILITDSVKEAEAAAMEDWESLKEKEAEAKKAIDDEEAKASEELLKKAEENKKQEDLKAKVEEVMEAEELAGIEENEPLEESIDSIIEQQTLKGAAANAAGVVGDAAAAGAAGAASAAAKVADPLVKAGEKVKQAIKDEL